MRNVFRGITVAALAIIAPFVVTAGASAAADTCTWTGAVDANWSNGANWSGCDNGGVPESGDTLTFPQIASNKTTNNDIVGLSAHTLNVTGTDYVIGGLSLTITGTVAMSGTENFTVDTDVTYTGFNIVFAETANRLITVNGVTNFSSGGGEVNVGTVASSGGVNFVGNITGSAGTQFIAVEGATIQVRGAANTYTASTVGAESGAAFDCRSASCFGDNANNIYSGGGIVRIYQTGTYSNDFETSVTTPNDSWLYAYDNVTITGTGAVNDPLGISQVMSGGSLQFTGAITNTGGISVFGTNTSSQVRFDGVVSGVGNFAFGSGTAVMSGAHTYDGTNTVNAGAIVMVDTPTGLGSTAGITNVLSGGSVLFDYTSDTTVTEPLQIAGSGIAGEGAIVQIDAGVTLSGDIALDGNATVGVDTTAIFSAFMLSGVISGTGDITLVTSPSTVLNDTSIQFTGSSANTYVGKVIVNAVRFYPSKANNVIAVTGDIEVNASSTKGAMVTTAFDESIADTSHITLTDNGSNKAYLVIGTSAAETIGYVTGDGELSLGATSALVLSYAGDYTFGGDISKYANVPVGSSTFYKQGSGTATFTGGVNTSYVPFVTPVFQVDGGMLVTNGAFTGVPVIVTTGTVLKGSGTVGYVTLNLGGTLSIGNSPGCMTIATLDMALGSTFTEEIAGSSVCTEYDRATVTGTATLNNATLNVVLSYAPADNTVFTIISAGSVVGTFNGLADGSVLTVSGSQFRINYTATTVTLTKLSSTTPLSNTGFNITWALIGSVAVMAAAIGAMRLAKKH